MSWLLDGNPPPMGWKELAPPPGPLTESRCFVSQDGGLRVITSEETHEDGKAWLHVSMSRRSRMPTYDDLATVKRVFVGDDLPAYQIFPVRKEHVNLHEYCLHLWAPIGHDPLASVAQHQG